MLSIPFVELNDVLDNHLRFLNEILNGTIDNRCASADCGLDINFLDIPLSCECDQDHSS